MRWDVTFNICMLRLVSYNMDYYWSFQFTPTATTTTSTNTSTTSLELEVIWENPMNEVSLNSNQQIKGVLIN